MKITCNLYQQWINNIRSELTKAGFDHSNRREEECTIIWQVWNRRIVRPIIRQVHKAKSFVCPPSLKRGLYQLNDAFKKSSVLWPWQSKLIEKPTYEDGLYNDYGVIHFHLGTEFDSKGYIKRTGELLFAIVDNQNVYEIGIYNHGDWYEVDILDIIDENWPHLLNPVTIQALDIVYSPTTRKEVKTLRDANILSLIKLKSGRIIAPPGGGVASDGTSVEAVEAAKYWKRFLLEGEKVIEAEISQLVKNGDMEEKDYEVLLYVTDDEIAGVIPNLIKWTIWKNA